MSSSIASSSSSSSITSSSSSKPERTYDVFFSFTTTEYDENFTSKLNLYLGMDGIRTFFDDQIRNESQISPSQLRAIEASRIAIVFLSKDYADSSWNLRELEKIMECHRTIGQVVLPVFYEVDEWEARKQSGEFGKAFEGLIKRESVNKNTEINWRRALAEVAFLSGADVSTYSETKAIESISESVHLILDDRHLFLPRHPVGLEFHAQNMLQRLNYNPDKVHMVGIWGIGGVGKTTVAKAIYNRMSHSFEFSSFLANINHVWKQDNGPHHLERQLISDILNTSNMMINSTEVKIGIVEMLDHKRALVVLDDVSTEDQLMALCGSPKWFGLGSIVVITTRNKDLFDHLEVDVVCEMKEMDVGDSLELFSWHAFKQFSPTNDFIRLSRKAITYCGGLPLALEVFGSLFLDRTMLEWKSVLEKLEGNTSTTIQEILKMSYDHLDDSEKGIFLEIASLYIGKDRYTVTQILNGYGFPAETGISVLIERSLLKVDKNNMLEMHELLQEMGRGINRYKPKAKWIYNVFLSFRGEDTRRSFASHLYSALKNAGIEVFMDNRLEMGENISSSLLQAIEGSRISIIIFSTNYAGSRWCLQEAEKIMECHRTNGQEVLPVFYGVEPSEVRRQTGTFGKALEELMQRVSASKDEIMSWRRAVSEAANLSGLDLKNYRTEVELIDHLLKTVTTKLDDSTYLFVPDHPVGVDSRVQDMIQLLSGKSNEVLIVGILGMGGIGKTTIAKAMYNEIARNFEGKSFLANIREIWDQDNGQVYLQEQLLSNILKRRRMKIHGVETGKTIIKESLSLKRAFIVLDDIDMLDQLHALCGSREWFGRGSRIIITTRNEHLLNVLRVDNVYNMKEMDENESLELFSWHAFKQPAPTENFVELSSRVVAYAGRLPLALEVLGSFLFDREIAEWESVLSKLEIIPNDQIQKKLKISFDGLSDNMEKDVFLDICCFFIGKDRNYVTQILNGCGLHAEIGIAVLIERNLVKVDKNNKLEMHALLQAMGKGIIREKSPEEPEKRSRLWFHDEVLDVLTKHTGTIAIKGLAFNLPRDNRDSLDTKAFKKMKRLRLLQLGYVKLAGDFEYLSKDLRWLCWRGFPLSYMPENFHQENLVAIDLKYSNLKVVWKESQLLDRLKILNLSHSHYLTQTPDFSGLLHLEKLILKDCPCLSIVHPTIGDLQHIILVNLKDCKSLTNLPRSIYKSKSLKSLILSGCSKIHKLEEDINQMESLTTLMADNTAITQVPFSLVRSKSIRYLSLCGYEGLSRDVFPSLIWSWMKPKNNPTFPIQALGSISSLLQSLSHDSSTRNCAVTETRPRISQIPHTEITTLIDFHDQVCIAGSENFLRSLIIRVGGCKKVKDALIESISQGCTNKESDDISLPGDKYPDWLSFEGLGSSVLFEVPQAIGPNLKGITLCIFYSSSLANMTSECNFLSVLIINHTKSIIQSYKRDSATSFRDEEWQGMISNLEPGDKVEVSVVLGHPFTVKRTKIYLECGEPINEKMQEDRNAKS